MKIAVIGASGNAGSRITAELARRGHQVTAIARHPEKIAAACQCHAGQGRRDGPGRACPADHRPRRRDQFGPFSRQRPGQADRGRQGIEGWPLPRGRRRRQPRSGPGCPAGHHPGLSRGIQGGSREGAAFLDLLRAEKELNWTFLSPSALFVAGERTGKFRLGTDRLLTAADGKSWISFEDFAVALADEIERPAHIRQRFTVGY